MNDPITNSVTTQTVSDKSAAQDTNNFMVVGIIVAFILLFIGLVIYSYASSQAADTVIDAVIEQNNKDTEGSVQVSFPIGL